MLEPAAREQVSGLDQRGDDGLVGVALLALVVDDAGRSAFAVRPEARGVLGVVAGIVDGEGDGGRDAARLEVAGSVHPGLEVLAAVTGRGVDKAGAGIVGDMIAGDQRHGEIVAATEPLERAGADHSLKVGRLDVGEALELELGLGEAFLGQHICKHQLFTRLRTKVVLRRRDLIEAVGDTVGEGDGTVAGDGPGRCGPDDNGSVRQLA